MLNKLTGWQRLGLVVGVPAGIIIACAIGSEIFRNFPDKATAQTKHLRHMAATVTDLMGRSRVGVLKDGESMTDVEIPPGGGYYDNSGLGQVEHDVRLKHPGLSDAQLIAMLRSKYGGKVRDFDQMDALGQQEEDAVPSRQASYVARIVAILGACAFGLWVVFRTFRALLRWIAKGFESPRREPP